MNRTQKIEEDEMQKWEYCILYNHGGKEYWLMLPSGEKNKIKEKYAITTLLSHLGEDGWEAVNFVIQNTVRLIANPADIGVWNQILLKRPKE